MTTAIVALFGIFNLVGGVIGYVKAKSLPSLIAGIISGIVLLACVPGIRQGSRTASVLVLVVALLLGGRFLGTWLKKKKVMPDLIIVIFSVVTLLTIGTTLFK